jgi:hypothetical protein
MGRYRKQLKLSPAQQLLWLRANRACCGHGFVKKDELIWSFEACPTPLSRTYQVRLTCKIDGTPSVYVLKPDLNLLAEGRVLPHVYPGKPVRLCLYYPRYQEWTSALSIAETIVPWTYLWLAYFEEWLLSGEWKGGGKHPGEKNGT